MELLGRATSVGQEQQPHGGLRDQQRLREDEGVRDERAARPGAPVRHEGDKSGCDAHDDHRHPERDVQSDHRGHPTEGRPILRT